MAKETVVILRDDIDGSVIKDGEGETIKFAFDGASYTIDLNMNNAHSFREAVKPYIEAAAKEVSSVPRSASSAPKSNKEELAKIRAWALEQGLSVAPRGRIAQDIQDKYHATH